jgi:hypothetical protein
MANVGKCVLLTLLGLVADTARGELLLTAEVVPTIGLEGFDTYRITATSELGNIVCFDFSEASSFGITGPIGHVNPFGQATIFPNLNSQFGASDSSQDSQFLLDSNDVLSMFTAESDTYLRGVFALIGEKQLTIGNSVPFLQVATAASSEVNLKGSVVIRRPNDELLSVRIDIGLSSIPIQAAPQIEVLPVPEPDLPPPLPTELPPIPPNPDGGASPTTTAPDPQTDPALDTPPPAKPRTSDPGPASDLPVGDPWPSELERIVDNPGIAPGWPGRYLDAQDGTILPVLNSEGSEVPVEPPRILPWLEGDFPWTLDLAGEQAGSPPALSDLNAIGATMILKLADVHVDRIAVFASSGDRVSAQKPAAEAPEPASAVPLIIGTGVVWRRRRPGGRHLGFSRFETQNT